MKKETELKPKGIHFKMDWDEMIIDLEDASVGKMIKNAYNYLNDRELVEMDKMETMLFKHTIKPVLEYNVEKYKQVCDHNAEISKKGVEAKKKKLEESKKKIIENCNNPSGYHSNPEEPKDKNKDISNIILDNISKEILNVKQKSSIKSDDIKSDSKDEINATKLNIVRMKKLVEIDVKKIIYEDEVNFIINVKELVRILEWARFELLIFYTIEKDVERLLTEYDKPGCLQGILKIKEHYTYFLDRIIK